MNLSRPKIDKIKGTSSKIIVEQAKPMLITTNLSSASNDKKTIALWKKSKEVNLPENLWYVKEREGKDVQIYLYVDIPNDSGIYEVLGKVIDMCLIPDTKVVYILTKFPKSHSQIKYQSSLSLYDMTEVSTKLCKQIIN